MRLNYFFTSMQREDWTCSNSTISSHLRDDLMNASFHGFSYLNSPASGLRLYILLFSRKFYSLIEAVSKCKQCTILSI